MISPGLCISEPKIHLNISSNCYTDEEFIAHNFFTWFAVEHPNIKPLLFPLKKSLNPAIFNFAVPRSPRIVTAVPTIKHKYSITKKAKHALNDCVLAEVSYESTFLESLKKRRLFSIINSKIKK